MESKDSNYVIPPSEMMMMSVFNIDNTINDGNRDGSMREHQYIR